MNRDQILGPLREIAFAAGVALVTFGVTSQATVELVSGVLLAIVSLVFAIRANEGKETVLTLVRKVLSGVAGGLVAWGKLDPAKAEALTGFALVLISSAWSFKAKGKDDAGGSGGSGPLWGAGMLLFSLLLQSCTPAQVEAFKAIPITIGIEGEQGTYGYSSKSGLSVAIKAPKVREEKSAPDFTELLEKEWSAYRFADPAFLLAGYDFQCREGKTRSSREIRDAAPFPNRAVTVDR